MKNPFFEMKKIEAALKTSMSERKIKSNKKSPMRRNFSRFLSSSKNQDKFESASKDIKKDHPCEWPKNK